MRNEADHIGRVRAAAGRLKVFPLPGAVLLPGGALPLHIFEERYRAMVADALATDGVFAMAQVLPGQERLLPDAPALEPMLCVGVISLVDQLPDGRFDLVLEGVARARLRREWPREALYREVEAEVLDEAALPDDETLSLRQALLELMARLPAEVAGRLSAVTTRQRGARLVDVVAGAVLEEPEARFQALAEVDPRVRLREVTAEVLQLAAQAGQTRRDGLLN